MMLLPMVASDVMFAHYAVRRNIIYAVYIIAEGNITCPGANIVRLTCFIAGRRSEVLSFFLFQSAEAKSVRQNFSKFLPVIVHNLCFVTFFNLSRVENSVSLSEAPPPRVCFK